MNVLDYCSAHFEGNMDNDDGLSVSDDDEVTQSVVGYPPDDEDDGCDDDAEGSLDDDLRICLPEDDDEDDDDGHDGGYHFVHNAINQNIDKPEVMDNEEYYERLDIRCDKWDGGMSTEELQGHIVAGLMARGETLSTGINANDLDLNMRDCTGLALESFLVFLDVSDAFRTRFSNDKSALLFEPQFKDIVSYSAADGNFKPALNGGVLPPCLQELHEILLKTGVKSRERKEKAEIVKIDRMTDPIVRRRCMISCNMLLEMMHRICQAKCISSVKWQDIQNAFNQMMTEEKGTIFNKYEPLLALRQLKSDHGVNLNQNTTRVLFGRGTISKALANDIYSRIRHEHDGTHLILSFHDPNDPGKDVYQKSDFDAIDALIASQARPPRPQRRYGGVGGGGGGKTERQRKEERERLELEERKKTFRMPSISSVYVPSESHSDHNIFGGVKHRSNEREERRTQREEERPPRVTREEKRPSSPPTSVRDSSEDRGGYQEYQCRRYEGGGFGPITHHPEESDLSDSEPERRNSDESDALSSDCERPVQPTEALFSDDEEMEQKKREEAERHEQMRREMEEKRKKVIAQMEAKSKADGGSGVKSVAGSKKIGAAHRPRVSPFSAPFREPEADVPEVTVKEKQKKLGDGDEPNGPVILTPSKARWGVPVEAETVPQKDNRLQEYCVAAAAAEKFSSESEDRRPPSTDPSVSTFMERAVDDSIPSTRERKRGPPPTYSTLETNFRNGLEPPRPALGSTRHETTINRTNVGVQSNFAYDSANSAACTDPTKLGSLRDVFISYISLHVFCNRSTEGIAVRTWSRISKGLDTSLRAPELFMGREWTEELERAIPNLCVVPIRGDLLFDWNDEPVGGASRRSSSHRL